MPNAQAPMTNETTMPNAQAPMTNQTAMPNAQWQRNAAIIAALFVFSLDIGAWSLDIVLLRVSDPEDFLQC
jgi:hypothetical protein